MAKNEEAELAVIPQFAAIDELGDVDFDSLAAESIAIPGSALVDKEQLEDVEFIVHHVNIRKGVKRQAGNIWLAEYPDHEDEGYASLEILTRDGNRYVFNDGSTGVYRQIVAFLASVGYIELPEGPRGNAKAGTSVLDTTPEEWADIRQGDVTYDKDGFTCYSSNIRLYCARGLRVSRYPNPNGGKDSETWYFA